MKARFENKIYRRGATRLSLALGLLATLFVAMGCGILVGNPDNDSEKTPKPKGRPTRTTTENRAIEKPLMQQPSEISISLADSPRDEAKEVWMQIIRLQVLAKSGDIYEIPLDSMEMINLLAYQNGLSLPLGKRTDLPSGDYLETHVTISDTEKPLIVTADDKEHEIKVQDNNFVFKIATPFTFIKEEGLALTIDFDLRKSIKKEGKDYFLAPDLRLVENHRAGEVSGTTYPKGVVCVYSASADLDATTDCQGSIASSVADASGLYRIGFLPEGTYNVRTYGDRKKFEDFANVLVRAQQTTTIETTSSEPGPGGPGPGPGPGPSPL